MISLFLTLYLRERTQGLSLFVRHFVFFIYHEALGLLVQIGFDITAFTPSAYQRGSLPRPSMEISS